jgi:hypothetical protein
MARMGETPDSNGSTGEATPSRVRVLGTLVLCAIACMVIGCSTGDDASVFRTSLPQEVDPPLPVVLRDSTGMVTAIEPVTNPTGESAVPELVPDPVDPKAFVVTWIGGPCERDATLSFAPDAEGYLLVLTAGQRGECPLIGYPRGVRIKMTDAIPISSIEVTGRG